jgi:hypothetical protein
MVAVALQLAAGGSLGRGVEAAVQLRARRVAIADVAEVGGEARAVAFGEIEAAALPVEACRLGVVRGEDLAGCGKRARLSISIW